MSAQRREFLKPSLRAHRPYVPGEQPGDGEGWLKLNTNEAPCGPSEAVLAAIRASVTDDLRLYPSPDADLARDTIAAHFGLGPDWVTVGNGADGLIELCFRAFAGRGSSVAFPSPSYPLLEVLASVHETEARAHPIGEGWALPDSYFADASPLRFLVNPDSPSGVWRRRDVVERAATSAPGVLVLDEAYVDFAPENRLDLLADHDNLLVLRTFSKSSALAGMRVGYALGNPELIRGLDLVKDSYGLGRPAIAAAAAAIADEQHRRSLVVTVSAERQRLAGDLAALGFDVTPSAANFLLVRPPARISASDLAAELRRRRILVRHYERPPLEPWVRITIGTAEQMIRLLEATRDAIGAPARGRG